MASRKDVDIAVNVAQKAYKTSWGRRCAAYDRGRLLNKLADIMEQHVDELCALESLDTGSIFSLRRRDTGLHFYQARISLSSEWVISTPLFVLYASSLAGRTRTQGKQLRCVLASVLEVLIGLHVPGQREQVCLYSP